MSSKLYCSLSAVVKCSGLVRFASILRLRLAPVIARIALAWLNAIKFACNHRCCLPPSYLTTLRARDIDCMLFRFTLTSDSHNNWTQKGTQIDNSQGTPKWADTADRLITLSERKTECSSTSQKQVNISGKLARLLPSRFIAFAYLLALGDQMSIMKGRPKKLGIT